MIYRQMIWDIAAICGKNEAKLKARAQNLLLAVAIFAGLSQAVAQSTAFTYQGRLNDGSAPANGIYDLRFTIYDSGTSGSSVSGSLTNSATAVSNGLFTVALDFGASAFTGADRWLEIGVRTNGALSNFATLSPRQEIFSTPYAIQAATANSVAASNILGAVSTAQLPGVVVTNGAGGVNLTGGFGGNGAGLTNLSASALPPNVALLNGSQTFSGTNRFTQTVILSNGAPVLRITGPGNVGAQATLDLSTYDPGTNAPSARIQTTDNNWGSDWNFLGKLPGANTNPLVPFLGISANGVISGNGGGLTNLNAAQISGPLSLSQLPSAVVTNGASGVTISGTLSGNGRGVTNVLAGSLTFTKSSIAAWGYNNDGETNVPSGLNNVVALAAGGHHCIALNGDGTVVTWGTNAYGQASVPAGLDNVVAVAAGQYHSLALKSDGTVVAWGASTDGETNVPAGLSNVVAVAAGGFHNLALKGDGTVVAWGDDTWGERDVPTGLSNVVAVAAGGSHSLALKSDGTVVAWGDDTWGQINVPTGLSNLMAVAAGEFHSLALKRDGTVVAWGDNSHGQMNVPAGLNHVMAVAAGAYYNLALKNDGTVVVWGDATFGETNIPPGLNSVVAFAPGSMANYVLVIQRRVLPFSTAVSGTENLRIVRGTINSNGSPRIGSGFGLSHTVNGPYTITFDPPFSGVPTLTVTARTQIAHWDPDSATPNAVQISIVNSSGTTVDDVFSFIAVGPQ